MNHTTAQLENNTMKNIRISENGIIIIVSIVAFTAIMITAMIMGVK